MLNRSTAMIRLAKHPRRSPSFSGSEGATIVEFALVSSVFLGFLLLITEASLAVYSYDFVSEAARDCARYAIVRGKSSCSSAYSPQMPDCAATEAQIQTHLRGLSYPAIITNNLTATVAWYQQGTAPPNMTWTTNSTCSTAPAPSSCKVVGNAVQVTVNYQYPFIVPFVKSASINMSNSSMMVISQ